MPIAAAQVNQNESPVGPGANGRGNLNGECFGLDGQPRFTSFLPKPKSPSRPAKTAAVGPGSGTAVSA